MFCLQAERERLTRKVKDNKHAIQSAEVSTFLTLPSSHYSNQALVNEATSSKPTVKTITPRYLIPDTNCFVDMLDSIQKLVGHTGLTVAVPLVGKPLSKIPPVLNTMEKHAHMTVM